MDIIKQMISKKFKTMCAFGNDIRTGTLDMYMTNNEQNYLEKVN